MSSSRKVDLNVTTVLSDTANEHAPEPVASTSAGPSRHSGVSDIQKRIASDFAATPTNTTMSSSPAEAISVSTGMQIGQYEIIRQLGKGGMGVVYLARDNKLGRRVAIKFLQVKHPDLTRRFIVEARATARCTHENIVVIHDVAEHAGSPFMVLEYVNGSPLSASRDTFPLPMTQAVEIITAVVRAMVTAHENGIVHRDLKPENILVSQSGTVKVLDFGIAKLFENANVQPDSSPSTMRDASAAGLAAPTPHRTGLVGTMAYMSPEQRSCDTEIDHRTDIWSVGVILYELLSGKNPIVSLRKELSSWLSYVDVPIPSLGSVTPQIPQELVRVVDTCLRQDRSARYASALELLRALEPFLPGRYRGESIDPATGPYAGLRAFQEADASRFFGRTAELRELRLRLGECALLAVVGPSGVGKSSFIRAGVVPSLRTSGERWFTATLRPGREPMTAVADLCRGLVEATDSIYPAEDLDTKLRSRLKAEPGYFGKVLRTYARRTGERVCLLIDQFEELYTLNSDSREREAFTAALLGAADDPSAPVRIVITLRADFLARVAEDPDFLNAIRSGLFFLGPPSSEGLREALVQPAELAGYRFETRAIVDEMVAFLESCPSGLPLLQFTASQLWELRDPVRHLLTESSYRSLGGVSGALVAHADRTVERLSVGRQSFCRNLFAHLVTPERTRAVRTMTELADLVGPTEELAPLVEELVASRLLVVQTTPRGTGVEIVHESLIFNWPTLRWWLDVSQEDSRFLDQLVAAAQQWNQSRRAPGLVWSGEMVGELRRFQRRYAGKLPRLAAEFEAAVVSQAQRAVLRRRSVFAFAAIFVGILFILGANALVTINRAKHRAEQSAATARDAYRQAEDRLDELLTARRGQKDAEFRSGFLEGRVRETDDELQRKNIRLVKALQLAQQQRHLAELAQRKAETNEQLAKEASVKAKEASAKAEEAKRQYQVLYDRERARANRLDSQVGKLVEDLH
jgi:serine/threonine protein kinase